MSVALFDLGQRLRAAALSRPGERPHPEYRPLGFTLQNDGPGTADQVLVNLRIPPGAVVEARWLEPAGQHRSEVDTARGV
ncbi:MAG: hypothetical protein JO352_35910 [Chloroflexi bacterium]|nr:hypothetical protein [Chloroflexota bacterium]